LEVERSKAEIEIVIKAKEEEMEEVHKRWEHLTFKNVLTNEVIGNHIHKSLQITGNPHLAFINQSSCTGEYVEIKWSGTIQYLYRAPFHRDTCSRRYLSKMFSKEPSLKKAAVKVRKRARLRQRLKTPVKKFEGHGRSRT
jgi:hypothetical protein